MEHIAKHFFILSNPLREVIADGFPQYIFIVYAFSPLIHMVFNFSALVKAVFYVAIHTFHTFFHNDGGNPTADSTPCWKVIDRHVEIKKDNIACFFAWNCFCTADIAFFVLFCTNGSRVKLHNCNSIEQLTKGIYERKITPHTGGVFPSNTWKIRIYKIYDRIKNKYLIYMYLRDII